jgi:hypothetical protein
MCMGSRGSVAASASDSILRMLGWGCASIWAQRSQGAVAVNVVYMLLASIWGSHALCCTAQYSSWGQRPGPSLHGYRP